jgi:hypothetical protein
MSIIFKMLKYLKNYSNLITGALIIALVIILSIQSIDLNNYKSSYQEEVKSGTAIQTELDSIKKQNEELKVQVSDQEIIISDRDTKIHELEKEIKSLKVTVAKQAEQAKIKAKTELITKPATVKQSKPKTFKADGNYNQATQVWNSLRALGLNEYVCAGIMGNIMAEVGGQTLDISRWPQYSQGSYYGICQWSGSRKQRLLNDFGTTLDDQIRFLSVELFEVIPKGSSFYNMQDEKEAALYFAKYYERCGSGSYSVRQSNATKALQYFTN